MINGKRLSEKFMLFILQKRVFRTAFVSYFFFKVKQCIFPSKLYFTCN